MEPHPASKSRLIRDLALRGAEAAAQERELHAEAIEFFCKVADGEIPYDFEALGDHPRAARGDRQRASRRGMSEAPFGPGLPLVIDPSAWHRQSGAAVRPRWQATMRAGLLVSCPVATLEILTATRGEREFAAFEQGFAALPQAPVTASACRAALAAAAAERGFGVLHADKHFDLLAEVLEFESVRIKSAI